MTFVLLFAGKSRHENRWLSRIWSSFHESPLPHIAIGISALSFLAGTTSAMFAGLNYFKVPRARASLVIDRFDDNVIQANIAGAEKRFHQLRIWLSNTGQSPAQIRRAIINGQVTPALTIEEEDKRISETAQMNWAAPPTTIEIAPGQKAYLSFPVGYPEESWSEFLSKKQLLYVFAELRYSDELSEGRDDVIMRICVRPEPSLNIWSNCSRGQNRTTRP
ncbi:hypothetical protein [Bradyrhizobium sp. AZCC 1610]|uniref:hypothetical protein n=1 Tax=Bradyrhizobium sp. AZCC 1610 TaxID=3117020 RepID=UPI002FF22001